MFSYTYCNTKALSVGIKSTKKLSLSCLPAAGAEEAQDSGDGRAEDHQDQAAQGHPEPDLENMKSNPYDFNYLVDLTANSQCP